MLKMRGKSLPVKVIFMLCTASFLAGSLFTRHTWPYSSINNDFRFMNREEKLSLTAALDCDRKRVSTHILICPKSKVDSNIKRYFSSRN